MRYLLLITTAFILLFEASAQQIEWNLTFPSHKSPPMAIKDIAPLDSLHAFIVGDFPRIGYTADGGKSWQYTTVNAPESDSAADFSSIHFTDALHGWAASGRSGIARTIDGGKSWQWGEGSFKNVSSIMIWGDMTFLDSLTGWAVGSWGRKGELYGLITRTNDGGKTWTIWVADSTYRRFNSCAFLNKNIGVVTGLSNSILRTSDGGVSWQRTSTNQMRTVENYVNIMPDSTFVISNIYTDDVMLSKDKGVTWNLDTQSVFKSRISIRFSDSLHGIIGGGRIQYTNSTSHCAITNDGGKTWTDRTFPIGIKDSRYAMYIASCAIASDGSLWQTDFSGKILRSLDNGNTWKNLAEYSDIFTDISFNTPLSGWVTVSSDYNLLLHTIDGGKTWQSHFPIDTAKFIFAGPYFLNESTGWYIATKKSGDKTLEKTTDGGSTWSVTVKLPTEANSFYPISDSVFLLQLLKPQDIYKWAISKNAGMTWEDLKDWDNVPNFKIDRKTGFGIDRLSTTKDSGLTWNKFTLPANLKNSGVLTSYIFDSTSWWIAGYRGLLASTADGGKTWKDYTSKLNLQNEETRDDYIYLLEFSDRNNGVLAAHNDGGGNYIFVTTNGGESWIKSSIESLGSNIFIRDLLPAHDGTFWACGYNGMLINWKPSVTNVEEQSSISTTDGISIYPNPTSTTVTISGIEGTASLRIMNSVGMEVISQQVTNGKAEIDISNLANGMYFVSIRTATGTVVKPIVVSR